MLFPEVQKKCHDELDNIVGSGRLPTIDDFERLPYIRQTIKEALRCRLDTLHHLFITTS